MNHQELTAATIAGLGRHMQSMGSGNPDTIVADYAENAVLFTAQATLRGHDQIRGFWVQGAAMFPPAVMSQFQMLREDVDGDVAFAVWKMGSTVPLGTETFVIRDGKIVVHTFVAQMA